MAGGDVCHAETHGTHHLAHSCHAHVVEVHGRVQHIAGYLDVELVWSAVELLLEKLSPNSSFFPATREPESGTRSQSILALGVWVFVAFDDHLDRKCCKSVFSLLQISHSSKDPAGQAYLEDRSRMTKVFRITVTGSRLFAGSRWELEEEEVSLVGYHIRWAALAHPEKATSVSRIFVKERASFMFSRKYLISNQNSQLSTLNRCRSAIGLSASVWQRRCNVRCGKIKIILWISFVAGFFWCAGWSKSI